MDERIRGWLLETVRLMVDRPEHVDVLLVEAETPVLRVLLHPGDVAKMIGKTGRTARALRTIVGSITVAHGCRFVVDIVNR